MFRLFVSGDVVVLYFYEFFVKFCLVGWFLFMLYLFGCSVLFFVRFILLFCYFYFFIIIIYLFLLLVFF